MQGVDGETICTKLHKVAMAYMRTCQRERIPYADSLARLYLIMLTDENILKALKTIEHEEITLLRYNILEIALEVRP
jgi:hypothetical protein